jgi:two-component system, chemotaxis family, protein-glutamate methylesterase/glutaminase
MPVAIAEQGERFRLGTCYIGEPAAHLTLVDHNLAHLVSDTRNELRNRTIDALFDSVARHAGRGAVGVVLSGALDDGSRGLAAIKVAGGTTMVVLSAGKQFRGMPENARNYTGHVDRIGTPEEIAEEIGRRVAKAGAV